jgi:hypothetical protein
VKRMGFGLLARGFSLLVGAAVILSFHSASVRAQAASGNTDSVHKTSAPQSSARAAHPKSWSTADEPYIGAGAPQWRYFVEFRARNAASYGHMYVMFGEVNAHHEVIKSEIAGLFPAGDARGCENCSIYYWSIGHVLPVPSEIGASDGDLEEQYLLARFRLWLDADQYRRLSAYIAERKAHKGPWNAMFANCVSFGRDVANFLNLKMSAKAAMGFVYPQGMVEALREANGPQHEQPPLKDAAGVFSRETKATRQTSAGPAESEANKKAAQAMSVESGSKTGSSAQ